MTKRQSTERCQHIAEWLLIATKGLCERSKARITLEIETHYRDAVEEHLNGVQTLEQAELLALEELGDPKEAGARFRKKHLTEKENAGIEKMQSAAFKAVSRSDFLAEILLFVIYLGIATTEKLYAFFPHFVEPWLLLLLAWNQLSTWASRVLVKRSPIYLVAGRLMLFEIFCYTIGCGVGLELWISAGPVSKVWHWVSIGFVIWFVAGLVRFVRLAQKVLNDKNDWNGNPSVSDASGAN